MDLGLRLLSLSRPISLALILCLYIAEETNVARMALWVIAAAFFVASSALVVDWIPTTQRVRVWLLWAELAVATVLTFIAGTVGPSGAMQVLFVPICFTMLMGSPRERRRVVILANLVAWLGSTLPSLTRLSLKAALFEAGNYGALLLFFGSLGMLFHSLYEARDESQRLLREVEQSKSALERAHRQLQESYAREQEMAVLQERQRLAREIHDSVAHGLTALVVQTQAAHRLLDRDPAAAAETIGRCESMAREALQETRRAVRALHPAGLEQQSDVEALKRLGRDIGIAMGMQVEVAADEGALKLPPDPQRLEQLYRIFQEALTNAHRHGGATAARASLASDGAALTLTISNNGTPPANLDPGVGLKSMRERAGALGGQVEFEPGAVGLTIRVTVPVREGVPG